MRAARWVALVALIASACSSDDGAATAPAPDTTMAAPESSAVGDASADDGEAPAPTTGPPRESRRVTVTIDSPQLDVSAELAGDAGDAGGDLFGDFATCSGLRRQVGSYAVGVGQAEGPVRWVSAVTAQRVEGPGSYDADVRVELAGGETIDAIGSLTLSEGLVTGTFAASTPEAELVTGTFECAGDTMPALVAGDADALAGLVEVVALLQLGAAERVVSVASNDPAVVECPLGAGGQSLLVRVDGDSTVGTIGGFELRVDPDGTAGLTLRVGAGEYEFDDVDVEVADGAGIFSAAPVIGPAVDGAFSCSS